MNRLLLIIACFTGMALSAANPAGKGAKARKPTKKDTIYLVGHAHQDMNWLWKTDETLKMSQDNLRQAVAFMEEYPDYTMLQSQAAVYRFVEQTDPKVFERVRQYVAEGRFEPVGGMWTEGDTNLSSGEALCRSFLLGQRYFGQHFGRTARVGWLPDNFGHIAQLPQLLRLAGMNYFYHMRCSPFDGAYWWIGPDSTQILCYTNEDYNGRVRDNLKDEFDVFAPGKHLLFQSIGEGDHGGGPSRADILKARELNATKGQPSFRFATAEHFFKRMEQAMDGRPTHRGEMQFIFEGCYTTVHDTKEGNRRSENTLYAAEMLNSLRRLQGDRYPADDFRELWRTLTFNEFHDILPGSAIYEANKEAHARYMDIQWKAEALRKSAFLRLADEIVYQPGYGQPVVAFNYQPFRQKKIVEALVYSYEPPVSVEENHWGHYYSAENIRPVDVGQGRVATALVRDGKGNAYPAQIVWSKKTPPLWESKIRFVVDDLPAGGYRVFYVDVSQTGAYNDTIPFRDGTFETDYYKIGFDMQTGGIVSLFDKRTDKEYVCAGEELNKLKIYLEDKRGEMKSWWLNKIQSEEFVTDVKSVRIVENGPVRACVETVKTWGRSRFIIRTYLYRSHPRIEYDMETHWLETGSDSTNAPMLRAIFPLNLQNPQFMCHTPFYAADRTRTHSFGEHHGSAEHGRERNDGQETPAQKWVDLSDGTAGIALLNTSKYGHSYKDGDLRLTLMRSAGAPDIYPNIGKFNIRYALYPHKGALSSEIWAEGEDYNLPVLAAEPLSLSLGDRRHATRPEEASFISVAPGNIALSGIKQSEDGDELIVRLYETEGKPTNVTVRIPALADGLARRLDLTERPLAGAADPELQNGQLTIALKPHEIATIGISIKN
ncbi:MAG: glycosyl hydrolase-related protein [Tannerella sp.]|jgi:alpha-mannosidase|nr:glycosyl hydrolase-related protein [Tannerella sp.]